MLIKLTVDALQSMQDEARRTSIYLAPLPGDNDKVSHDLAFFVVSANRMSALMLCVAVPTLCMGRPSACLAVVGRCHGLH